MTTERKYALLLRKKEKLENRRKEREREREAREERERKERERLAELSYQEEEIGVDALDLRKEIIVEMFAIGDWDGLRRELSEFVVGGVIGWSGPILAGATLVGLPLLREIFLNWLEPVGVIAAGGTALYILKRVWRYYRPSMEEIEDELYFLETELGIGGDPELNTQTFPLLESLPSVQPLSKGLPTKKTVTPISQPQVTRPIFDQRKGYRSRTILEVIMESEKPHFLIVGATGAGKTTLVRHVIRARYLRGDEIIICDPHNIHGTWGPFTVRGGGANWEGYMGVLTYLKDVMLETLDKLNKGKISERDVPLLTCYLGEWSWATQEMDRDASDILASLIMGSRKAGIRLIVDAQSDRVESLGIKGRGDLRDSLARVRLSLTGRNGETRTVRYDGQKVKSAGPFEGWNLEKAELTSGSAETPVPVAETPVPVAETPVPSRNSFPSTEIKVSSAIPTTERATLEPHNQEITVLGNDSEPFPPDNKEIKVSGNPFQETTPSEVSAKLRILLEELGEDFSLLGELLMKLLSGSDKKELMSLFKNTSGRLYKQRKEVLQLVYNLGGVAYVE